ncbi:MAG: NrfD/PsrC family molybdoenzyme membrane anchor subunit [Anaerolineales bacterium]
MNLKRALYALAGLALLIGAWGVYDRLAFGHTNANYGSYVVWGLWVAMYLFFAGVAAGAFMIASLDLLFHIPIFKGTGRIALWTAIVSLGAGLASIWLDLGHMERIWKVYLQGNPSSVMFQMVWGYTLFGLLMAGCLFLAILKRPGRLLRILMGIGLVLSLFVSGAVGALLGVQAARPFWHVGLFPVQFPVFSLASGAAVMLSVLAFFGPRNDPNRRRQLWVLSILSAVLILVKLYFIWADYSVSIYGNVPQNVEAVRQVLFGQYWWAFWILQGLIGSLIPLVVLVQKRQVENRMLIGWMGVFLLIGYAVARALIIFPALTIPELENLASAFGGPHLTFEYFPSLMEWAVTIGTIGLATMGVLLGGDFLPLYRKDHRKAKA